MGLEQLSRKLRLPDDGLQRADAQLFVVGYWNRDGGTVRVFLHDDVTAARRREAEPAETSSAVTYISPRSRPSTSEASAVSMKSSTASRKLAEASSTESPWLATSSSGQRET
jgi:hypothetical protein